MSGINLGNRILITGATGFVGKRLCQQLLTTGYVVRQAVRTAGAAVDDQGEVVAIEDIGPATDWQEALCSVDAVVHLAAHVHQMKSPARGEDCRYWQVNTLGTERLAVEAAKAGVRRFVYLSSIKVNGEQTTAEGKFTETQPPHPADPYGRSKAEAEKRLRDLAAETAMDVVIIRPPLVYGPGVAANFAQLLDAVWRGLPLPLATIRNFRSLIYVDNLVDFILATLHHPAAAGQTFLIADGEDLPTPGLIQQIAVDMGRPARLWPCPLVVLKLAGRVLGRAAIIDRLCDSLRVDSRKAQSLLGWQPPYSVNDGLRATVDWYMRHRHALGH